MFADERPEGVGRFRLAVAGGKRQSAHDVFLAPVRRRANLHIVTDAQVKRIILAEGRVRGVRYFCRGKSITARCAGCWAR
jgi:choline dehydrogenase